MMSGNEFKPLAALLDPDLSSTPYSVMDPAIGVRPLALGDTYAEMEALALPETVPTSIRGYFDATRMLWVYGWFYYPYYTWAAFHATACAEMGLRMRYRGERITAAGKHLKLAQVIEYALAHEWMSPERFSRWRQGGDPGDLASTTATSPTLAKLLDAFRETRNFHAHPAQFTYFTPVHGYDTVLFAHDLLVQLFPA